MRRRISLTERDYPRCNLEILKPLIDKYKGNIYPISSLIPAAQYAVARYMTELGSWETYSIQEEPAVSSLSFYSKTYGNRRFGLVIIPTLVLLHTLFDYYENESFKEDCPTFAALMRHYQKIDIVYRRNSKSTYGSENPWPVILNSTHTIREWGLFSDGWNRLHHYVALGMTKIPCVWLPKSAKDV